ncbi:unnamed protein product [Angiostrongylus costaricensis]|uniref:Uncharacterized protein n=1 Tax=Angiostrongylus costaricensis TaxID=334426 RepID=A0A0R3PE29_ANGCS|nr:unnamed protein product [Angiostrongylus costaricensis]
MATLQGFEIGTVNLLSFYGLILQTISVFTTVICRYSLVIFRPCISYFLSILMVFVIYTNFLFFSGIFISMLFLQILLYLSENPDDTRILNNILGLEENLSKAAEKSFPPNIIYNILIVVSRLKASQVPVHVFRFAKNSLKLDNDFVDNDNNAPVSRKFVARRSKQLIYEFDELPEELKTDIERRILTKKGVISIYFNLATNRAVIRTVLTVDAIVSGSYCLVVVKIDGVDEHFKIYASEREKKATRLPDYLDDLEPLDPNSCVVTNDFVGGRKQGGWFSTFSTFVKSSLW